MEIERKFLLAGGAFPLEGFKFDRIRQGYLSTSPVIRIRQKSNEFWLTVKGPGSIAREEFELPLSQNEFACLARKLETGFLDKTRYYIPLQTGHTAELDVYEGELFGLATVEVEFESLAEAEQFVPPDWFGKDISNIDSYKNSSLAQYGLPKE